MHSSIMHELLKEENIPNLLYLRFSCFFHNHIWQFWCWRYFSVRQSHTHLKYTYSSAFVTTQYCAFVLWSYRKKWS